ncbi:TIGR01777 family oxidoreductase [Ferruginibacter sp. HRS2-29]|uniref:TIGR01777 family oxidoreductase n=1 Tax=Ferruginibacter sp. HRS2-29 TaxID=2487334 RepID=UPI0020CBFBD3|nr:TIGR01777 family oxidoreductase [Ferruginibacter sp. HRS2-29]MCP9751766.1 TIGR01777 family protein [Ferruginibacter sp. HRS2-29]
MQTVLITGGTGLLGHSLVKTLTHHDYHVIILTRSLGKKVNDDKVSYALWDVKARTIDVAAVQKADHIIHLAGAGVVDKKWTEAYKKEIIESRTESARLIVETLANHPNSVKSIISASAIGWYGEDKVPGKAFTEDDPPDSSFLGETCRLWEQSISTAEHLRIRVCKIRIGILLSTRGGAFAEFVKPVKFGFATILGSGKQMVSWIHVEDVCRIFLQAIQNNTMSGSYNAVAPAPVDNKTLMLKIGEAVKGKFFIPVYVPSFVLKIMMGQRSVEILKSSTVSCTKIKDTGFTFLYPSLEAALEELMNKKGESQI